MEPERAHEIVHHHVSIEESDFDFACSCAAEVDAMDPLVRPFLDSVVLLVVVQLLPIDRGDDRVGITAAAKVEVRLKGGWRTGDGEVKGR